MYWRDVVELVPLIATKNDYKEVILTPGTPTQVFANKKSVARDEFYKAVAVGIKVNAIFEVRSFEYNNETRLNHNGIDYEVIRTYSKNDETIELTCSQLSTVGGSIG